MKVDRPRVWKENDQINPMQCSMTHHEIRVSDNTVWLCPPCLVQVLGSGGGVTEGPALLVSS